jgi:DNA-binding CsgD family transcriptional regulator
MQSIASRFEIPPTYHLSDRQKEIIKLFYRYNNMAEVSRFLRINSSTVIQSLNNTEVKIKHAEQKRERWFADCQFIPWREMDAVTAKKLLKIIKSKKTEWKISEIVIIEKIIRIAE